MRAAAGPVRKKMLTLVMLWVAALMTTFALPSRAEGNLLSGKSPSHIQGVSNAKVLTDGARAHEGDEWNSIAAAVMFTGWLSNGVFPIVAMLFFAAFISMV